MIVNRAILKMESRVVAPLYLDSSEQANSSIVPLAYSVFYWIGNQLDYD